MAEDYDPYSARSGHAMTNNLETFIHLIKSSLGTGILAMPKAFSHVGLAEGAVLVYAMGAFCVYGLHILVNNLHLVCKSLRVPALQYGDGFQGAVAMGPDWVQPLRAPSVYMVEFFLVAYQLGICCIYVAFAAENLTTVVAAEAEAGGEGEAGGGGGAEAGPRLQARDALFMAAVAAVLLPLAQIRSLKVLAPVSLAANVAMGCGQVLIWSALLRDLPPLPTRPLSGPLAGLPPFMGTVLFAMESLGVIITLENNMARPAAFTGLCGILNAGMAVVVTLYAVMGFFGFYRYGADVADVITLNMPADWTGQAVRVMYAVAVTLTYPLQLWPVLEVTWDKYGLQRWVRPGGRWTWLWETLYRSSLVVATYLVAITLPNLDFVISLLGVLCLSMLGITFPALMEMCTHYELGYGTLRWTLVKDVALAGTGVFVLVVGLWTCVADLLDSKS